MSSNPPPTPPNDLESRARAHFSDLTEAELKLLRAAPRGEFAVCGPNTDDNDPANDPAKADQWSVERQICADLIRWLCVDRTAKELVDPKGIQVYAAKVTGALDLSFVTVPFRLALVHCRLMDDANLRNLEIPGIYLQGTSVRSIAADGAVVKGDVFLRDGFRADGEVSLVGAQIGGTLDCSGGTFTNLAQKGIATSGRALTADRAVVKGTVFLHDAFRAEGAVRLPSTRIGGNLECSGGTFTNPPKEGMGASGMALSADGAVVKGTVFLNDAFRAEGAVHLVGAQICGDLDCSDSTFMNRSEKGSDAKSWALSFERALVGGSAFLRKGFHAEGEVRILNAQIGGDLDCSGGTFANPPKEGKDAGARALSADRAVVKGTVFLNKAFRAEGAVRLVGAEVGGALDCSGGTFTNPPKEGANASGVALSADRAVVKGTVFLNKSFRAEGAVRLVGAQIESDLSCSRGLFHGQFVAETAVVKGRFFWTSLADPERVSLNLTNASVDALVDEAASWPGLGNLILDGFVYGRIFGPRHAASRLDWLARQAFFAPQPYRQLAKVLREEGDNSGARRVLSTMERLRRAEENSKRNWFLRFCGSVWSAVLSGTIGYGYHPGRSLVGLIVLVVLGLALFGVGYAAGSIAPTDKEAYVLFKQTGQLPSHYDRFNPFIYSLESSFPLIKLGQADRWQPDANERWQFSPRDWVPRSLRWLFSPWTLRRLRWVQICLGWFFATMGVAAVTGIVRKD